jgi:conjugal transfer/entry exclusion protein
VNRRTWTILLIAVGVVAAVLIGIYAVTKDENSQANAQASFCSSVSSLESSVQALDPSTASQSDYQDDVSAIEGDWDQVKSDASDLASINMSTLDSAWDSFKSAVDDVPDDASVSDALNDVKSSADSLVSTVQSTLTGPDCSSS